MSEIFKAFFTLFYGPVQLYRLPLNLNVGVSFKQGTLVVKRKQCKIARTTYGSEGHIGGKHSSVVRRGRGVFGCSFCRWFGRFWKKEWEYIFDAMMGLMVMLGCGCGILSPPSRVTQWFPWESWQEAWAWLTQGEVSSLQETAVEAGDLPHFVLKDI